MGGKGKNALVESIDDNRIIELFFARSEDAVPALTSKYGDGCMKIAQRVLNNAQDAEECVNDAYLRIWQDIPPKRPNPLAAYVFRIVRNLSINRLERNTAKKRAGGVYLCLDELKDCVPSLHSVEDTVFAKELSVYIDSFIDTLNYTNRLLFVRRYWYLDSFAELSRYSGLGEGAIRTRLSRIRNDLKKYLERKGMEL